MLLSSFSRAFQWEHQTPLRQILLLRLSLHGMGSMCVSSLRRGFSHTLSSKLESYIESFVLGRNNNQNGAKNRCGEMNGTIVHNGITEEGVPTSRNQGESSIAWNERGCKQPPPGLTSPSVMVPYTLQKIGKMRLPLGTSKRCERFRLLLPSAFYCGKNHPEHSFLAGILSVLSNFLSS